jgi:hypothetical protein
MKGRLCQGRFFNEQTIFQANIPQTVDIAAGRSIGTQYGKY